MEFRIGGLYFSSNFDSGNLSRVERVVTETEVSSSSGNNGVKKQNPTGKVGNGINNNPAGNIGIYELKVDYDYKVWTRPDCAGTPFENANRSWFHFLVRGYAPGKVIRVTIMNMNKQSKLYSQGYSPLYRVCHSTLSQSRWQRIRERPAWEIVDGQFNLTFIHRFIDPRGSSTYFAFSFPWSYKETQRQLNQLDAVFHSQTVPLPAEFKTDSALQVTSTKGDLTGGTDPPEPVPDGELTSADLFQKVYFYRELLCYSLEGRQIDLLTITDWSGRTEQREEYFDPLLFPNRSIPRPWKFEGKKVVFISARVHPGETPSSHVFNGLLELLLRPNDARACQLRKQYVFKLIPLLNPDGVVRGHYRTDSRGVNLNRVYLEPDFLYYPSIYAAKALMVYYHTRYGVEQQYAAFLSPLWEEFKQVVRTASRRITKPALFVTDSKDVTPDLDTNKLNPSPRMPEDQLLVEGDLAGVEMELPEGKMRETSSNIGCYPDVLIVSSPVIPPTQSIVDSTDSVRQAVVSSHPPPPVVSSMSSKDDRTPSCINCRADDGSEILTPQDFSTPIPDRKLNCIQGQKKATSGEESTTAVNSIPVDTHNLLVPPVPNISSAEDTTVHSVKTHSSLSSVGNKLNAISKSCKSSRLLAAFRTRRRSSHKVDCLPYLFTKWNAPLEQAVTLTAGMLTNLEIPQPKQANKMENEDMDTGYKEQTAENSDSAEQNSRTKPDEMKQNLLEPVCIPEKSPTKNRGRKSNIKHLKLYRKFGHKSSSSSTLSTSKKSYSGSVRQGDQENSSDPVSIQQDPKCLCSLSFEPGNEGSDEEEDVPLIQTLRAGETEDLSINQQYLDIIDHITTFVEQKQATSQPLDGTANCTVEEALKELHRLRKASHLSETSLRRAKSKSGLAFYIDLHGHCSKRGCFLYGNWLDAEDEMTDNVLFALLVAVNSYNFDFNACNFSMRNMYQRDRRGTMTKEGSGRVAIWKHLGLVHSYTLECNYNSGPLVNRLWRCLSTAPPDDGGRLTPPGTFVGPYWTDIVNSMGISMLCPSGLLPGSNLNAGLAMHQTNGSISLSQQRYTPAHFEEVGRALLFAVLDVNQTNPWPRWATLGGKNAVPGVGSSPILAGFSELSSMKALRDWVRRFVRGLALSGAGGFGYQLPKPSIFRSCQYSAPQESSSRAENLIKQARNNRLCQMKLSAPVSTSGHPEPILAKGETMPSSRTGSVPDRSGLIPIHPYRQHSILPELNPSPRNTSSENYTLLSVPSSLKNRLRSKQLDAETSPENSFAVPGSFEDNEKSTGTLQINNAGLQNAIRQKSNCSEVAAKRNTGIRRSFGPRSQDASMNWRRSIRQSEKLTGSRPSLSKEVHVKLSSSIRTREPCGKKDGKLVTKSNSFMSKSPRKKHPEALSNGEVLDTNIDRSTRPSEIPPAAPLSTNKIKTRRRLVKSNSEQLSELHRDGVDELVLMPKSVVLSNEKYKSPKKLLQLETISGKNDRGLRSVEDKIRASRSVRVMRRLLTVSDLESSGDVSDILTSRSLFSLPDVDASSTTLKIVKSKQKHTRIGLPLSERPSMGNVQPEALVSDKKVNSPQILIRGVNHLQNEVDSSNNNFATFGRWNTIHSVDLGYPSSSSYGQTQEIGLVHKSTQSMDELHLPLFPCVYKPTEGSRQQPQLCNQRSREDRLSRKKSFDLEDALRTVPLTSSMFFSHHASNG